ncbi:MAG: tetratricopeptide repeat protein [Pseudohongiellaceae bacterium]
MKTATILIKTNHWLLLLCASLLSTMTIAQTPPPGSVVESQGIIPGRSQSAQSATPTGANSDAMSLLLDQNRELRAEVQTLRALVEELSFKVRRLEQDSLTRYTNIDQRLEELENRTNVSNANNGAGNGLGNTAGGVGANSAGNLLTPGSANGSTTGGASSANAVDSEFNGRGNAGSNTGNSTANNIGNNTGSNTSNDNNSAAVSYGAGTRTGSNIGGAVTRGEIDTTDGIGNNNGTAPAGNTVGSPDNTAPNNAASSRNNTTPNNAASSRNNTASGNAAGSRNSTRPTLEPVVLSEQQLYQLAYDSVISGENFARSISEFDQYLNIYPQGRFASNAHYWKGQAFLYLENYEDALDAYELILNEHPDSSKVPDAMYGLALTYQGMGNIRQTRRLLNDIKRRFPNSGVANLADTRLLSLD